MVESDTFTGLFLAAANRYSDSPAFTSNDLTLTYGELDRLSARVAGFLQHSTTLMPGDRVALQLANTLSYPVAAFAILRAGLILVNTNPRYTAREMALQLQDCTARALVLEQNNLEVFAPISDNTRVRYIIVVATHSRFSPGEVVIPGVTVIDFQELLERDDVPLRRLMIRPSQTALLQYTSGTTGEPKGVMITHRNLVANIRQMQDRLGSFIETGKETVVAPLPLYHIYGFSKHCMLLMVTGNHSLLVSEPGNTDSLVNTFDHLPVTGLAGLATLFERLLNHPRFSQQDFSHFKVTFSGGMPLPVDLAEHWQAVTGSVLIHSYGMTEASPVISMPSPYTVRQCTVGFPLRDTEVRVVNERGDILPGGCAGGLQIRGPQVMAGYWQRPKETEMVLARDGWFATGDVVILDKDNYLKIVCRKNEVINVSGFNVVPAEIEGVVLQHPDILEAVAVSMPGTITEGILLCVVKKNPKLASEHVIEFCRLHLTAYKVPSRIEFFDHLPKSSVGKILRHKLRDFYSSNNN